MRVIGRYPRIYLDLELYRPETGRGGRSPFFHKDTKIILTSIIIEEKDNIREYYIKEWTHKNRERGLIQETITILKQATQTRTPEKPWKPLLIGYNILSLDIPILLYKSTQLLGEKPTRRLWSLIYRGYTIVDLFQYAIHIYNEEGLPSLTWLEKHLGININKSKSSGYIIHSLYEKKEFDKILAYARDEMTRLRKIYTGLMNV